MKMIFLNLNFISISMNKSIIFLKNLKIGICGDNISIGEKQLISIGRTMLRKARIILIDEPTSNIDEKTEALISYLLKNCF